MSSMSRRGWVIAGAITVIIALTAAYILAQNAAKENNKPAPPLMINGLCEAPFGGLFICRAYVEPHNPIVLSSIGFRIKGEEAIVKLPTPIMIENAFAVTYTVTPSKASLVIYETSPTSILTFYTSPLRPDKSMCKPMIIDKRATNLTSGALFPYEAKLQPSSNYAYLAQVILRVPRVGGAESLASIDAKLFLLQDTLAWEFYEAEPAPLLPRTVLIPLGGLTGGKWFYTKLAILYNRLGEKAPESMPIELRIYRTSPVHLVIKLKDGEVYDAVLPLYCH